MYAVVCIVKEALGDIGGIISKCGREFGLLVDVDGVVKRGQNVLPTAKDAIRLLTDDAGHFIVPTVFATNATNVLSHTKAKQLSDWLSVEVILNYLSVLFAFFVTL